MASLTATNAVTADTDPTTAPQNSSTDETNNHSLQQGETKTHTNKSTLPHDHKSTKKQTKMSDENMHYIMSALQDGKIPSLPSGCTHHFFISKHDKFQKDSLNLATFLIIINL